MELLICRRNAWAVAVWECSWYLPARVGCSPPSAACLICLWAVSALLNWRVSSFGFRIKSLLLGASYSCASDFNTAQCLSLDLSFLFWIEFVHSCVSPTQCQHGTSKSLNINLREIHGKSGPLLLRFNLLAQSYLLCDHCLLNRRYWNTGAIHGKITTMISHINCESWSAQNLSGVKALDD